MVDTTINLDKIITVISGNDIVSRRRFNLKIN